MKDSKIEWTTHTFQMWRGCSKVSAGCKHCYAEALLALRFKQVKWGPDGIRKLTSPSYRKQPFKWDAEAKASGVRARVFCSSLSDVFDDHGSIPVTWRVELFDIIRRTPNLDWLMLTKRPENIRALVSEAADYARINRAAFDETAEMLRAWFLAGSCPPNVWLGVSVEDMETAKKRIPELLKVPAKLRFLSCEPLLERLDLRAWLAHAPMMAAGACMHCGQKSDAHIHNSQFSGFGHSGIGWVIVGGESGHGARTFDVQWAHEIVNHCAAAAVPSFVKQIGARPGDSLSPEYMDLPRHQRNKFDLWLHGGLRPNDTKGGDINEFPEGIRVRQFPEVR